MWKVGKNYVTALIRSPTTCAGWPTSATLSFGVRKSVLKFAKSLVNLTWLQSLQKFINGNLRVNVKVNVSVNVAIDNDSVIWWKCLTVIVIAGCSRESVEFEAENSCWALAGKVV